MLKPSAVRGTNGRHRIHPVTVAGNEPFDGSTSSLVWHAVGGVLAIAFVSTALVRARRRPTEHAAARTTVIWTTLGVVSVGNIVIGLTLTALVTAGRLKTAQRIEPAVEPDRRPAEVGNDEG